MPGFELEDDDVITEFFVVANFTLKEIDFFSLKYFSTFCSHSTFRTHLGQVIYSITHFKQTFLRTV